MLHPSLQGKTVLISGASSGIGKACAEQFASVGSRIILFARSKEHLMQVQKEIKKNISSAEIYAFTLDITNKKAVKKKIANLPPEWSKIDILINNAGCALGGKKIQDGNTDDWDQMINVNIRGLLYLTHEILPKMLKKNSGTIINISSIASQIAYPEGNVYCATKAAVRMISEALRVDLVDTNIRTIDIQPGKVKTNFREIKFKGDYEKVKKEYQGYCPLVPEDVAEVILFAASRKEHIQIQEIIVTPSCQANAYLVHKKKK